MLQLLAHRRPCSAFCAAAAAAPEGASVATEAPAVGKTLREVTQDDFYEVINSHGDKLTVVDCYTEW